MGPSPNIKFSLIVSSYNLELYIGACLESLKHLNYQMDDYEIICVDDGSTDNSPQIIDAASQQMTNTTVIYKTNGGLESACNHGIREARFDYVVRVDADDMLDNNFLHAMNSAIIDHPNYDFYYCRNFVEYFNKENYRERCLPEFDPIEIFNRGDFLATGTVYQKTQLIQIGLFPEEEKNCGLENYNVILKLLTAGKTGLAVPDASFYYRRHNNNMSTIKRRSIINYGNSLLKLYGRAYRTNENHPYGLKLK